MLLSIVAMVIESLEYKTIGKPKVSLSIEHDCMIFRFIWSDGERWGFQTSLALKDVANTNLANEKVLQSIVNLASEAITKKNSGFSTAGNQWS